MRIWPSDERRFAVRAAGEGHQRRRTEARAIEEVEHRGPQFDVASSGTESRQAEERAQRQIDRAQVGPDQFIAAPIAKRVDRLQHKQ